MKDIFLKPYVSYSLHFIGTINSRSYIVNEKLKNEIMLEGLASDLWTIITKEGKYSSLIEFAKQNNIANELDDFLFELYYADLIESTYLHDLFIDDIFLGSEKIDLSVDENLKKDFYNEKRNYFLENGFLYSLSISLCELFPQSGLKQLYKIIDIAKEKGICCISLNIEKIENLNFILLLAKYIREKNISLVFNFSTSVLCFKLSSDILGNIIALCPHKIVFSSSVLKEIIECKNEFSFEIFSSFIDYFIQNNILISIYNEETNNINIEKFKTLVLSINNSVELLDKNCYNQINIVSSLRSSYDTLPSLSYDFIISNNKKITYFDVKDNDLNSVFSIVLNKS